MSRAAAPSWSSSMAATARGPIGFRNIDALARHFRVVAFDLPGYGASPDVPKDMALDDYVAWVAEAVARRRPGGWHRSHRLQLRGRAVGAHRARARCGGPPRLADRAERLRRPRRHRTRKAAATWRPHPRGDCGGQSRRFHAGQSRGARRSGGCDPARQYRRQPGSTAAASAAAIRCWTICRASPRRCR